MEGIAGLKTQYCEWLDGKQWDHWASLFTDDAVMQIGPSTDAAVRGRAAIKQLLARQLKHARTLHKAWDPQVTEEAPGRVRVVWHMNDRVETPLYVLEGAGFYEDRYVRTDDGWKIAGVRLHRSGVELRPKSLVGEALHVGLAPGERP